MAEVILKDVTKVYPGDVVAVKDANLDIKNQEFIVLVGPSGCGKSTTLRMVAGLEEITGGTIRIGERVVNDVPPKDRDIAMVFQNYALYPHMTVYKNLAFGLKLRKYPKREIDGRVQDAARILGITELLDRKPKALSGGQRQRVAVGRAIVRKPAAFLFDEPLSNLDAKLRVEMRKELNQLHKRLETTMIYVTHDQIEAMTLGDRIVVMNDGVIQQVAEPLEVYDRPVNHFVASFIGTPPMNFIEGELVSENGQMFFARSNVRVSIPAEKVAALESNGRGTGPIALGIRPEDVMMTGVRTAPEGQSWDVPVDVQVVEPLGDEMILYLRTAETEILGKVDSHNRVKHGDSIQMQFSMDRVHLFCLDSGANLTLTNGQKQA